MKDTFFQIKFGRALLVMTWEEFQRALRRGATVKRNRKAAEKRRRGEPRTDVT